MNKLRLLLPILLVAIVISVGYGAWVFTHDPNLFPFKRIKVIANYTYVKPQHLQRVIAEHLEGGFFSLHLSELKASIVSEPWIEGVAIRRIWPSTLLVRIEEQRPAARWNGRAVFSQSGELFFPKPETIPKRLPSIEAPNGKEKEIFIYFQKINKILSKINLTIRSLSMNNRGSWGLLLSNGIPITLGRTDVITKISQFVEAYPKLIGENAGLVDRVDLRYTSGLAIKWRR